MYMHQWDWSGTGPSVGFAGHEWIFAALAFLAPVILLVVLWSVVWKGLALWHAARRGQYWWFFIILVVNTLGILEIIYLFFVAKIKWADLFSTRSGHEGHAHHH